MFNLFNKKPTCPVDEKTRIWMEDALIWLINQFGEKKILAVKTLIPTNDYFPINFSGEENVAFELVKVIAQQMDINDENVKIEFYNDGLFELQTDYGTPIHGQLYENEMSSTGLYLGKDSSGKFTIAISRKQLTDSNGLIATIAHELAHIKILGENRLNDNDEYLTDLVTVFFGLGVFTSNCSGRFTNETNGWKYSQQGYLTQQEWGYALALYAYIRREDNPYWLSYLTKNIQSDFQKSREYILRNGDKVLV